MTKRPDMQVVGEQIAHLRREKGLCAAAFARELDQPAWLIMLLESAHLEQSKQLIDLLPDSIIHKLLREIQETYGVSNRRLTTRFQLSKRPPLPKDDPCTEPMLLPIIFTPEDAMTCLENLITLAHPTPEVLLQNEAFFRTSIQTVSMLFNLQIAHLRENNHGELADQYHHNFQQLLNQRITQWAQELGVTDITVPAKRASSATVHDPD